MRALVRRLSAVLALCACAALASAQTGGESTRDVRAEWSPVWQRLQVLVNLPREDPEHAALRRELLELATRRNDAARKRADRAMRFRARILSAALERHDGRPERRVVDPGLALELLPGEAEWVAEFALPGPTRARALLRALDEAGTSQRAARAERLQAAALEASDAGRLEEAEFLAHGLLDRERTLATSLVYAAILRRAGRPEEARELLDSVEPGTDVGPGRAAWADELARLERARGREGPALDALGSGLAAGSRWARLELAERAGRQMDRARALALTRPFLDDGPLDRAAWGEALLPPRTPPSAKPGTRTPLAKP